MNLFEHDPKATAARRWMQEATRSEHAGGSLARTLPDVERALKAARVLALQVNYDGRAAEGDFTTIRFIDADHQPINFVLPQDMHRQLCAVLGTLRDHRYPKWRTLEGAYGQFAWNLATDVLEHRHSTRYIEYETWFLYGL